jgi:hypothetical protein
MGSSSRTGEREGGWLREFSLFSQYLNMRGQSQDDPPIDRGGRRRAGSKVSVVTGEQDKGVTTISYYLTTLSQWSKRERERRISSSSSSSSNSSS